MLQYENFEEYFKSHRIPGYDLMLFPIHGDGHPVYADIQLTTSLCGPHISAIYRIDWHFFNRLTHSEREGFARSTMRELRSMILSEARRERGES